MNRRPSEWIFPPDGAIFKYSLKPGSEQFEKLALEEADMLYRVACRLTHGGDEASDLVQETYLRALRGREGFDLHEHGIRPWLVRIMHNVHLTRIEREKRQPVTLESDALEEGSDAARPADAPFAADSLQNMDERLVRALGNLPPEYQVVLLLWAVEEMSYKEIAAATGVPIGTVMSRLHRSRQRLATLLRGFAVQEGIIRE